MLWLAERVHYRPDVLKPGVVYICGDEKDIFCVSFRCPCGCERDVNIPVKPWPSPSWDLTVGADKRVTLSPSLLRKCECKSHFFVRDGVIKWCGTVPEGAL